MREASRQWNGATITARSGTIRSRLATSRLYRTAGIDPQSADEDTLFAWSQYFWVLSHCTVKGDLGFDLGSMTADQKGLQAGFDAFMEADEGLWDTFIALMTDVDNAVTEEATAPDPKGN